MEKQNKTNKFVRQMFIALICGILGGLAFMAIRENLVASGKTEI